MLWERGSPVVRFGRPSPRPGSRIHLSLKSILVRASCSGFVMCRVLIVGKPNETYSYAAVDQQTGEVPLRLTDRHALVALCQRVGC
jgi:hypothetical protein